MFKFKRTIATLIAMAMVLGLALTATANTTNAAASKHAEAIATLKALGIMVGDKDTMEFREEEAIKRSEFAKVAVHALGLEAVAEANSARTRFPDVVENHWANGYINVATNQGIIVGDPDGNFRPDDNITYAEATTILVRMLGYEPSAKSRGGYPTGYIVVGAENGLNARVTNTSPFVNRGTVAQMTFNSLDVNLMEQTGFGTDAKYSVVDKTLLSSKLKVEKVEGLLTANEHTTVGGGSGVGIDKVMIGDKIYNDGGFDTEDILGHNVTAYAKEDAYTGEMALIVVIPDSVKNKTVTIDAEDIHNISADEIKYWAMETKLETLRFSTTPKLIYNGKADDMANIEKPVSGSVTLIDNNSDNRYEVITVREHRNIVVEDTSGISYTVIDKYGNPSIVLDPEDTNIKFSIKDEEGNDVKFEDLKEWDVLSTATSRDGMLIRVTVIRNSFQGKVSEITTDKIIINGKEYEVAANYADAIELEDEAMFYLDISGKIAAVDTNVRANSNYAYLVAGGITSGIDSYLELQLFMADGKTEIFRGAEKMNLDGVSGRTAAQVLESLKNGASEVQPTLVTYELNSAGEIYAINRPVDRSGAPLAHNKGVFTLNAKLEDAIYRSASSKLGSINVNEDTIVFDIPAGKNNPEDYAVRNHKMFENDAEYDAYVFDMTEDMTAKVIIVTNSDGQTSLESPILVVDKITKVNNENNIEVFKVYGLQNGERVEIMAAENQKLEKEAGVRLAQGDIIQYKTNFNDEIDGITVLFDARNKDIEGSVVYSDDAMTVYGKVEKRFNGSINVSMNDGAAENFRTAGATVYKYDSTKSVNQITIASAADIQKYDSASPERVFIRLYKDEVKEIVIIR